MVKTGDVNMRKKKNIKKSGMERKIGLILAIFGILG